MRHGESRSGFTLIELLVVVAIIAILAAILFPVFLTAQAKGRDAKCMSNLRQIGMAFQNYNTEYNGRYMIECSRQPEMRTFVGLLFQYTRSTDVFLCPSAPRDKWGQNSWESWADAPDQGWYWPWDSHPGDPPQRSHYGQNIYMTGVNPDTGEFDCPPTEAQVRNASRVAYLCDARWVDLIGSSPGRIGMARFRHNGGLNVCCADGHSKWLLYMDIKNDRSDLMKIHWDYRY